ncbi:MAG TPA: alpha/beta fold hydrolase [Ferrovibrio sp.]|uniref:alpha/beta hydrolase n=1 Tax=Ferrovibrio sp. TaxID=1917215 RepID=UPI002ED53F50
MRGFLRQALPFAASVLLLFALSARAEPVRLVQDGRGLDGELALAGGKSIKDGLLILVHGTLAHSRMEIMRALQQGLAQRDVSTLAITLSLGISDRKGMYDCAQPHRHSNAQALREIDAWVAWAQQQGAASIGILGHSRGGAQVAHYAASAGDRLNPAIKKIVLVAPMTFDLAAAAQDYKAHYGADLNAALAKAEAMVRAGKGDELLTDTDFLYCPKAKVAAASFVDYHATDGRNDAPSQLAGIKRPVLLVAAGGDEVVRNLPQRLAGVAKTAGFRLVTVDGADHMFQDLYGEDLADAIASFWTE